jgi:methionyl aminopeptidase
MIIIKSNEEIEAMRKGGKILSGIMAEIGKKIAPGVNTWELDELAERLVFSAGGIPVFKGYGEDEETAFPATICTSINEEVVHGIPKKDKIIGNGDLVKIDIGMRFEGMVTDMTRTFEGGSVSPEARKLLKVTQQCLNEGIKKIKAGAKLREFGKAVEGCARANGFSVVRDLVGHGVGRELHEKPQILNYFWKGDDTVLKEGMTLALEPMVNAGSHKIKLAKDGWTFVTADGKLSAQFEDTVVVRKGGCEVLTR